MPSVVLVTEPLIVIVAVKTGFCAVPVFEASILIEKLLYANVSVLEPVVIVAPPLIANVNENVVLISPLPVKVIDKPASSVLIVVPLVVQPVPGAFKTRAKLLALSVTVTVPAPLLHVNTTVLVACKRGLLDSNEPKIDGPSAEIALNDALADFFCVAALLPAPPPPHETITSANAATKIIFKLII